MAGPNLNGPNVDQVIRGKDSTFVPPGLNKASEEALNRVADATAVLPTLATEVTLLKVLDAVQRGNPNK